MPSCIYYFSVIYSKLGLFSILKIQYSFEIVRSIFFSHFI